MSKGSSAPIWGIIAAVAILIGLLFLYGRSGSSKRSSRSKPKQEQQLTRKSSKGKTIVKLREEDGMYYIPAKVNGTEMEFVFDGGASNIVISQLEFALLLKQGKVSQDDIVAESYASIADGSKVPMTIINFRSIEIGGTTLYDVQGAVMQNPSAPLLLGQSALGRFGSFTFDNAKRQVIFHH